MLLKLSVVGQPDAKWGSGGRVDIPSPKDARSGPTVVQSDGRFVVSGNNKDESYLIRVWD